MSISDQIREARERAGMSQEVLAEHLGVSRQAVSKWEVGTSVPTPENFKALADLLKIELPPPPEAPETVPAYSRWRAAALVSVSICLLLLAGAAMLTAAAVSHGWLIPEDPSITAIQFYDETGAPIARQGDGWYHFPPESSVTAAIAFQHGRKTLSGKLSAVIGVALYLTPTGTNVYNQREQLAVQDVHDGNLALFICQFPQNTLGHLDVVLECAGGQSITETLNITTDLG